MIHPFLSPRRAVPALLTAAAVLLAAALPAQGQPTPSDSVLRAFQATGEFSLLVNGKPDAQAQIFVNRNIPAYLLLPGTGSPVLISPGAMKVELVPLAKIARQKDGSIDILADAVMTPQGNFQLVGERVELTAGGRKLSLGPKPPLLGLKKAADLKQHSPEYLVGAKAYTPNPASLAKLRKQAAPVRLVVYFGSWCPHCKEMIPHLLRVEDEIKGSKIQIDYHGLPQDFKDPDVQRLNIREVPTAIVYRNGKEIGRITRNDWAAPEVSLSVLLGG